MRMRNVAAVVAMGVWGVSGLLQAAEQVKAGEKAMIHCTCRFKSGELAATTREALANDPSVPKSSVFQPAREYRPVPVVAGDGADATRGPNPGAPRGFEGEISRQLGPKLVGMAVGERRVLDVASGVPAGLKHEDRFLQMARVRQRPKFLRMTPEEYKMRTQKDPQVDQAYVIDPAVPGKVVSVDEKEVVIQFSAQPGQEVKTPLGKGVIREAEKHWEIVIDAKKGDLIRSGPMVGRIVEVDDRTITIDYGHPFGGEALSCEVEVVSIER